jgi:uncharacterized protein YbgA (DUF1722 family)/uncharacterized protein YbbK (DUF523 family)
MRKPRLGISSCLLGENVRFNGGHKRDRFLTDTLGELVEWVPLCPEFEMGLGAPRNSLRLVGDASAPRLMEPATGLDRTAAMEKWTRAKLNALESAELDGFILKKDSPTCGAFRVKVWHEGGGGNERKGVGLFARRLMETFPLLPVEEEGRLNDPRLRENFIGRVFCHHRWVDTFRARPRPKDLVAFHAAHKLTLLSHSPQHYRELGRLVARAGKGPFRELLDEYGRLFMEALKRKATPAKHVNVLQHLQGFFKRDLDKDDKAELGAQIAAYRAGLVPLIVPLTLIRHHLRRHPDEWAAEQTYLNPYPVELMLRNHV